MTLSLIVAMAENRVIGKNNTLPWHLSEDLKRFKALTMGHPIIMGRKTYESIGKPLPGRQNIVVTNNKEYRAAGIDVAGSLCDALARADQSQPEKFVIGGSSLFEAALPLADRVYLTVIRKNYDGDVYFPNISWEKDFKVVEKTDQVSASDEKIPYTFITYERIHTS